MAVAPRRLIALAATIALTIWIWALAFALFKLVWNSVERPLPPLRELFPYGEMRIGVDPTYPPFAAMTGSDLFGLDVDIGRALGERLGIPVRFVPMGFDGLYDSIKADQVDMVISALLVDRAHTAEVLYTQPYFDAGLVLVTNADGSIQTMDEIAGHKLALEFGSEADAQARLWERRVASFDILPYELPQYALDAVRLKTADAALVDAVTARLYFRDHPDWTARTSYVTHAPYAIALRIDHGSTWDAVNRTLQAMMDDGALAGIIQKWL
jgi:polar amino acid transport system substrate-binding protein